MEDSPPPQPYEEPMGLFGSEKDSLQSVELHYETVSDKEAEPTQPRPEEPRDAVYATYRGASGVSANLAASRNGRNSTSSSPQRPFDKNRFSSANGAANGTPPKGGRLSLAAMAASFGMPSRSCDAMNQHFLPKSPQYGECSGNGAMFANGGQATGQGDTHLATGSRPEVVLHSPTSLSRRRRQTSKSKSSANRAVSASPEHPDEAVLPTASMQEEVKRYMSAVVQQHTMTLAAWEKRVFIAEAYSSKPLRTGGRPAPARSQDVDFLERIERSLDSYLHQLEDAKSLLLQRCEEVLRAMPCQQRDVEEWQEYCSRLYHTLSDFAVRENLMRFRVRKVLSAGLESLTWPHAHTRTASSRASSARGARSCSRGSASPRTSLRPASRGASMPTTPRQRKPAAVAEVSQPSVLTASNGALSPYARHPVPASLVRRSNGVIRPGHSGNASPVQASATSVDLLRCPRPRGGHSSGRAARSPRSPSSARALSQAAQPQRLLPSHSDRASPRPSCPGNTYDSKMPYARLSPHRLTAPFSPLRGLHLPMAALRTPDVEEAASCSASPSHGSSALSPTGQPAAAPPQLGSNSPRGTTAGKTASSMVPASHSFRHRQLLETIDYYEKNASALQRDDLQSARACFYELYGEQTGLREYCQWIDNVAMKALHGA
ncbi:hypothetical protein LSCM1_03713 [Leishmania martiniquensis]|uniref:Uncharacterized protein n=1 Tax=Leishmania martiniquensis TaxID=1580590 RepID=A0A836GHM4_9TRYP|nr:hypothetical protein LSCM1_03713 [Leishmania martiniquensis]